MARKKPRPGDIQSIVESIRPAELEGIENAPTPRPTTTPAPRLAAQMEAKAAEDLAVRAISGGSPADVASAVAAFTPAPTVSAVEPAGGIGETGTGATGSGTGGGTGAAGGGGSPVTDEPEPEEELDFDQSNALDIVKGYLKMWKLDSLTGVVEGWIKGKVSEEAALMNLRNTKAYKERFSGLELRSKAGMVPIDEATYLALEDDYDAWARYYGVEAAFGTSEEQRQKNFGVLIGKNVNANTFKEFVDTVVTRVDRAEPAIKQTLNRFYGITDADLKNYYVNPSENIKALQEKVTAAEIGAAGIAQALNVTRGRAEELARFGIDRERAITGFERVAGALPEGQRLAGIYREEGVDYTQETAEEEEFMGLESAARKRRRLSALSEASFGGSGAVTQGALGTRAAAGQI